MYDNRSKTKRQNTCFLFMQAFPLYSNSERLNNLKQH